MAENETSEQGIFELPEFEGTKPVAVETKLTGAGQRIIRPLGIEQRVILVVEAEVDNVNHVKTGSGIKRVHTLKVKDLYEAEGKEGKKLLSNIRLRAKKAEDARTGHIALDGVDEAAAGIEITTDGNGTALTPDEVAAARGEENPPLLDGDDDVVPVVLIFSDASRALWPDDYVNTDYKSDPYAGDFMPNPNRDNKTEDLRVIEVQDVETGESLGKWGEAEENAKLLEEEKAAAAAEAEEPKPAKKAKGKKKATPKVITDEITPALEADAAAAESPAPELPGDDA